MKSRQWICPRQIGGLRCGGVNQPRARKCHTCGKPRPPRRRAAHLAALTRTYEEFVELNGGEQCGICGATRKPGAKRLHRDHDHRTGQPRGILCFRCNAALRPYMTLDWMRAAVRYLERSAP